METPTIKHIEGNVTEYFFTDEQISEILFSHDATYPAYEFLFKSLFIIDTGEHAQACRLLLKLGSLLFPEVMPSEDTPLAMERFSKRHEMDRLCAKKKITKARIAEEAGVTPPAVTAFFKGSSDSERINAAVKKLLNVQ